MAEYVPRDGNRGSRFVYYRVIAWAVTVEATDRDGIDGPMVGAHPVCAECGNPNTLLDRWLLLVPGSEGSSRFIDQRGDLFPFAAMALKYLNEEYEGEVRKRQQREAAVSKE